MFLGLERRERYRRGQCDSYWLVPWATVTKGLKDVKNCVQKLIAVSEIGHEEAVLGRSDHRIGQHRSDDENDRGKRRKIFFLLRIVVSYENGT